MRSKQQQNILIGVALSALATSLASTPAHAQAVPAEAAAAPQQEIVVTGSRIRRSPLDQDKPVVTVDQAAIASTGLTSIADVLQRLPSAGGGLNTKVNKPAISATRRTAAASARARPRSTCAISAPSARWCWSTGCATSTARPRAAFPPRSTSTRFPLNMIDRVEVLQSGASPLYGSDAIAGVVNIITKQSQKGLQASGQFGTYRQGDGHTQNLRCELRHPVAGTGTSLVFGVSYVKQDAVHTCDRSISLFPTPGATSCAAGGCSSAIPQRPVRRARSEPDAARPGHRIASRSIRPISRIIPRRPTRSTSHPSTIC